MPRIARDSEAVVHAGIPGDWQWQLEFEPPERLHFALQTAGEDQHWIIDGGSSSAVLAGSVVTHEPLATSDVLSIVRFLAVVQLGALLDPERFATRALAPDEASGGDPRVLAVRTLQQPEMHYRLHFDDELRLVLVEGPLAIPAIGGGAVRVRFSDFRIVDDRLLPFAADYEHAGEPLLEERVVRQRAFPR